MENIHLVDQMEDIHLTAPKYNEISTKHNPPPAIFAAQLELYAAYRAHRALYRPTGCRKLGGRCWVWAGPPACGPNKCLARCVGCNSAIPAKPNPTAIGDVDPASESAAGNNPVISKNGDTKP